MLVQANIMTKMLIIINGIKMDHSEIEQKTGKTIKPRKKEIIPKILKVWLNNPKILILER